MTRILPALAALALLVPGCATAPRVACGPFYGLSPLSCFPAFDYRSVVRIDSGRERGGVYRWRNSGSGILIDPSGLIVTASHVVNGRKRVAVYAGSSVYAATPVPGGDFPAADVAYLRITADGREVPEGCVLSSTLSPCRFPSAQLSPRPQRGRFGAEVQVVGFPDFQPEVLSGRLVDPRPRVDQFAAEYGLGGDASARSGGVPPPVATASSPPGSSRLYADALALLKERIRDGYLFVELDSPGAHAGTSGGAVLLGGEAVGMVIESWNSFERPILICVPLPALSPRRETVGAMAGG